MVSAPSMRAKASPSVARHAVQRVLLPLLGCLIITMSSTGCGDSSVLKGEYLKAQAARLAQVDATSTAVAAGTATTVAQVRQYAAIIATQQALTPQLTATPVPPPYKLALISASCTRETDIGYRKCEGYVKNITSEALSDVEVVISWVDANGTPYSTDNALIDDNPILPGQQSPWSTIGMDNPALTQFHVQFKELMGTTILTRDDR